MAGVYQLNYPGCLPFHPYLPTAIHSHITIVLYMVVALWVYCGGKKNDAHTLHLLRLLGNTAGTSICHVLAMHRTNCLAAGDHRRDTYSTQGKTHTPISPFLAASKNKTVTAGLKGAYNKRVKKKCSDSKDKCKIKSRMKSV